MKMTTHLTFLRVSSTAEQLGAYITPTNALKKFLSNCYFIQVWHKSCFNCSTCHRPLDSMQACDGPDREIYCKPCYGKLYGPKGFGYGHSPTLISTNGESTILL